MAVDYHRQVSALPLDQLFTLSLHMAMGIQYITVELARPAVVFSVSFGKFEKSHACNLRKFSVYGGMECDRMHLLCEG